MRHAQGDSILCLEGEWSSNLEERLTVEPILTLLDRMDIARSIHRDVATRQEFDHYVDVWRQKRYAKYKVLYLAMHGDHGRIMLGRDTLSLDELEVQMLGACSGKVVYFGSCLTLSLEPKRLQQFAEATGARAVVGYRRRVDWIDSAAFEVLLLTRLSSGLRSDALFNRLTNEHPALTKSLGLVVATRTQVHRVPLRQRRPSESTAADAILSDSPSA